MKKPSERDIEQVLSDFGAQLKSHTSLKDSILSQLADSESVSRSGVLSDGIEHKATVNSRSNLTKPNLPKLDPGGTKMFKHLSIAAAILILMSIAGTFFMMAPQTSFAQVIENIKGATSYSADFKMAGIAANSKTTNMTGKIYWQQPGAYRMDQTVKFPGMGKARAIKVFSATAPGIQVNFADKTFTRLPPFEGATSPLIQFQQIADFNPEDATSLGKKKIDGKNCVGFQIAADKVDPSTNSGTVKLWIDESTDLPAVVVLTLSGEDTTMEFENFRWNEGIAPELFNPEPPKDFVEKEDLPIEPERAVTEIVKALRAYAKVTGGEYPKVKVIYGDVIRDKLYEMDAKNEYMEGNFGWAVMSTYMRRRESSYHGIEVNQSTPNEVLFRWKRDDGKFQVIYGNLESAIEQ